MEKIIIYDNRSFCLGTSNRYYFARVKGKSISLHRYKFQKEKGEIPAGWHVHHKYRNCFNNNIDNLEAIDPKAHSKLHPTSKEILEKWQAAGIKAAPVWHASEEGKKWHEENYKKNKIKLHSIFERNCSNCNKPIFSKRCNGNCFCNNACKSAWRRKNKEDLGTAICPTCNTEFVTRRYLPKKYCSLKCKPAPNPLGYYSRIKQ